MFWSIDGRDGRVQVCRECGLFRPVERPAWRRSVWRGGPGPCWSSSRSSGRGVRPGRGCAGSVRRGSQGARRPGSCGRHRRTGRRWPPTKPGGNELQQIWKQAIRRAGLPKDLSIHCARHTVAVHLLKKTGTLHMVQKQLGHASTATTANMYADGLPRIETKGDPGPQQPDRHGQHVCLMSQSRICRLGFRGRSIPCRSYRLLQTIIKILIASSERVVGSGIVVESVARPRVAT